MEKEQIKSSSQLTLSQVVADANENAKTMLRILRAHFQSPSDDGLNEEGLVLSAAQVLARARQLRADLAVSDSWQHAIELYNKKDAE